MTGVLYDLTDGVATIRLDRPDAMNSLDVATKERLRDVTAEAAADPLARCVVLTGTGRAFCTGQDLKEHARALNDDADPGLSDTVERHFNPIVTSLATMEKPVIAAVNGVAAGAGASLAFACDLRTVADTAGCYLAFAGIGLSCDTGSSWTLQRPVGQARAIELLYLPRTVPADEALAWDSPPASCLPTSSTAVVAELAARLAPGRRSPSARCGTRSPTPPPTRWRSRWPSRAG